MFGRRADGRRVKGIDPIVRITPYIMPERNDAQVILKHRVDMEILSKYIKNKNVGEDRQLSYMQIIIAAYVRAISCNPEINRFIMNKHLYARNNCSVAITILRDPFDLEKGEAVAKIKFDLTDTLFDVCDRINAAVTENRGDHADSFIDRLLAFVFAVPGLASICVRIIRFLDRHDIAPAILMEELPFYVSMYITNTGSIGLHDVNHHLYNWGNVGMFLGMGMPEKIAVVESGETRMKRFLPIGITVDERICSGAHYARFFKSMKRYLEHPELLEVPPNDVRYDEGCEYHEPKIVASEFIKTSKNTV